MARIRIADGRLEALISEDVPYIDLTTEVLGIGDEPGEMQFFTRDAGVLAGVEYAARMAQLTGCEVVSMRSSGERMQPGDVVLTVRGSAASLHEAWKASGVPSFRAWLARGRKRVLHGSGQSPRPPAPAPPGPPTPPRASS